MEIAKVLELASQILSVLLLLSGVIGFVFRTWISEWIKSKFSKAINKELEVQKHQLNKELEAYKVSLIRDMEDYKANIDIKRSIALKMADARLEALRLFAVEFGRYGNECMTWPRMHVEMRQQNADVFLKVTSTMQNAFRAAEIFMSLELVVQISSFNSDAGTLVNEFSLDNEAVLPMGAQQIQDLMKICSGISLQLRELIFKAPALLGD